MDHFEYSFWIGNTEGKKNYETHTNILSPDFLFFKWRQTGEWSKCAGTCPHDPGEVHELDVKEP